MATPQEAKAELQKIVDDLRANPELVQYVNQHKLALIDSRLEFVDIMLNRGIVQ